MLDAYCHKLGLNPRGSIGLYNYYVDWDMDDHDIAGVYLKHKPPKTPKIIKVQVQMPLLMPVN